eukprot:13467936-Ditylum_brightwellii.AAC.1
MAQSLKRQFNQSPNSKNQPLLKTKTYPISSRWHQCSPHGQHKTPSSQSQTPTVSKINSFREGS